MHWFCCRGASRKSQGGMLPALRRSRIDGGDRTALRWQRGRVLAASAGGHLAHCGWAFWRLAFWSSSAAWQRMDPARARSAGERSRSRPSASPASTTRDPSRRQFGAARIPRRARADLAVQGVRRSLCHSGAAGRRELHRRSATGAGGCADASSMTARARPASPMPRWRRCSAPTGVSLAALALVRHRGDRAGWRHALCRHRARQSDRALRFRQGRSAGARAIRSRCRPAVRDAAQQQGARGACCSCRAACRSAAR